MKQHTHKKQTKNNKFLFGAENMKQTEIKNLKIRQTLVAFRFLCEKDVGSEVDKKTISSDSIKCVSIKINIIILINK